MDAWQFMEAVTHRGYYAKISAAAAQRPEQFFIILWIGGSDTAVGQDNLRGEHIVKRQSETPDQRSIAAAQSQPGNTDNSGRARHGRDAERVSDGGNVGSASAACYRRAPTVRADDDASHIAEVDNDAFAQAGPPPVRAAAEARQRQITLARRHDWAGRCLCEGI